jgi:TRAP-type C4-dicarboxylate transport system substrate-binding protein
MTTKRRLVGLMGVASLAMGLVACGGQSAESADEGDTETVRLSSFLQQDTAMGMAVEAWADETEECTDGALEIERFHNASLFDAMDTRDAIGQGRAEIGIFSAGYHTGEFPLTQGLFDVPFMSSNVPAVMGALQEMYDSTPEAEAEFGDQGLHLLSMLPVTPVPVGTKAPFESLDDLSGLNIRGYPPGGLNAAIDAAGANPVDMDLAELPEAMQRGVTDGYTGVALDIAVSMSLHESTSNFTEPGFGSTSAASLAVNKDWWEGLPEDIRNCASEAANNLDRSYIDAIEDIESDTCDTLSEAGAELSVLPQEETQRWEEMIREDQVALWSQDAEGVIDDPATYLAKYEEAVQAGEEEHSGLTFGVEACLE